MQRIAILGAGISGLSLAWYLKKKLSSSVEITILEKKSRVGGWIETQDIQGFLFEKGPRGCRPKGKGLATLQLIEELELQNEVIGADPSAKTRFLYTNKQLQPLPQNLLSFILSPLMKGVIPAFCKEWIVPSSTQPDESIFEFVSRRLNPEIAHRLIDPLTRGIYAGDIHQLSMRSCFPTLYQWEQENGSLLAGMIFKERTKHQHITAFQHQMQSHALFSFRKGLETLPIELSRRLNANIMFNAEVKKIEQAEEGVNIKLADGNSLSFDHVFSTLTPHALSAMMPPLKTLLDTIPSKSIVIANYGFNRSLLPKKGFGYLIPSQEEESIMGAVWDSCTFPQQNRQERETRITFMMDANLPLKNYHDIAQDALERHLGIKDAPDAASVKHIQQGIPQYLVGHEDIIERLKEEAAELYPSVTLLGTGFYGVGVNDCIANAKDVAQIFCKKKDEGHTIKLYHLT